MAISREAIFAAADELVAAGERPTLEGIRKKTGGSYTTISPLLNEWKARHAAQSAPVQEPIPQAVQEKLSEVGGEIWRVALELANSRLAAEREALEKARAEIEAERGEAVELADQLNGEKEALQARVAALEASEAAAKGEVKQIQEELAKVREEAAGLRGRLEASQEQMTALLSRLSPREEEKATSPAAGEARSRRRKSSTV